MPRVPNFEPSIDDCLTFDINIIKSQLKKGQGFFSCTYNWYSDGRRTSSMQLYIQTIRKNLKTITFNYAIKGESIIYSANVVAIPSNLGVGNRWYLICPKTGNRCSKLICPKGSKYFYHRTAFRLLYGSQKRSKSGIEFDMLFGDPLKLEDLYDELCQKYRKRHYRGKPTPLVEQIAKLQNRIEQKERRVLRELIL